MKSDNFNHDSVGFKPGSMIILPFASSLHCVRVLGIFRPQANETHRTKRYWSKNVTCFMVQLMQNVILCTGLCHFLKVHCWTHTPPHYKPTIQQFQTRRLNECFIVKCKGYKCNETNTKKQIQFSDRLVHSSRHSILKGHLYCTFW